MGILMRDMFKTGSPSMTHNDLTSGTIHQFIAIGFRCVQTRQCTHVGGIPNGDALTIVRGKIVRDYGFDATTSHVNLVARVRVSKDGNDRTPRHLAFSADLSSPWLCPSAQHCPLVWELQIKRPSRYVPRSEERRVGKEC